MDIKYILFNFAVLNNIYLDMENNKEQEESGLKAFWYRLRRRIKVPAFYKRECKILKYQVKYEEYLCRLAEAEMNRYKAIVQYAQLKSAVENNQKEAEKTSRKD